MKTQSLIVFLFLVLSTGMMSSATADKLDGRLITFKKTFDGWWDVACDTAPDGTDARCYVQYVDPYSLPPNLRAAMVDFVYRKSSNGTAEPVISFDVEPDLSFARDVEMTIVGEDGSAKRVAMHGCPTGNCVFTGTTARVLLVRWSNAKLLRLRINERSGKTVMREWPLGNMREILRTIKAQRKARGLP